MLVMPRRESPAASLSSRKVNGRWGSIDTSQREQLCHLDGHGVDVDAIQTMLDDLAAGLDDQGVGGYVQGQAGFHRGLGEEKLGIDVATDGPGFDELAGQVAAGGDEEGAGAHGDVGHPQGQDLLGGPELPRRTARSLERAGRVHQGFQGAFGDLFGQEPRRVVRAGAGPEGALGDVEGAGEDHNRVAAQVLADDPVDGQ